MLKRGLYWRMKFCSASSASASVSTTTYSMLSMNSRQRPARREVRGHALADRFRLAHVDDAAARVVEQVDPRLVRQAGALLRELRHSCNKGYEADRAATPGGVARFGGPMRYRLILPIAALLAALVAVPAAQAKVRVGLSEQNPAMFDQVELDAAEAQARPLHPPVGLRQARRQPRRGHRLHERRRARKRQEVLVTFSRHAAAASSTTATRRRKACKAPSQKAYKAAVKALPQGVPLHQDVHAVERGQPRLPADVPQAQARGELLQGAQERLQGLHGHGGRRARLERREDLPAPVPARVQGQGPHLGPAQLQGRQPPPEQGREERPVRRQGQGLADRDRRHREVQAEDFPATT